MESIIKECVDCGQSFEITEGEQKFFASKKLELPKRCLGCRQKRKIERQANG